MNTQVISVVEQIKALNEQIKMLKLELPEKVTPQYLADKREFVKIMNGELIQFNKVHKVVTKSLSHVDGETFKSILSESQLKRFNAAQYEQLKKSFKLTMKVCKLEIGMEDAYSTAKYINNIISGSCLSEKTFKERKAAK